MTRYDVLDDRLDDREGRLADHRAAWRDGPWRGSRTRRPRTSNARRLRVLGWISAIMTLVVVSTSLVAYAEWRHLWGNIQKENVNGLLGKRPPKYNSAMNILLIGSDSRAGSNKKFGEGIQGARSDTMILMHISPQGTGATLISFPRDSEVSTVACQPDGMGHDGQQASRQVEMLNATFDSGGAPCTWKTLEALTGIRIDHFIEIDFGGFQSMVNAVGGVTVCLPEAIHDPASKLNLSAGTHHVDGAQALAFVRERHVGLGSDLQRIQRQQFFLASLAKQVTTSNMLGDPGKLLSLANAATHSLTTDSALDVGTLLKIAESMRGLHASSVNMISVPVVADASNPNRVDWAQPASNALFNAIKFDSAVHVAKAGKKKAGKKKATPAAAAKAPNAANPSHVNVQVLNGTMTAGLAGQTATALQQRGFNLVGTGNASNTAYVQSVIQYASAKDLPAVEALSAVLSSVRTELVPTLQPGTLNLVLGSSFTGLKSPSNLTQAYGGISGSTNICKDASAFSGPDQPSDFAP
ncbi:MAG TPA: LCP family protein [Streptosporangiaceae bacterium]|nr:LCP family protein [Streptosporangiaceae bacterium]